MQYMVIASQACSWTELAYLLEGADVNLAIVHWALNACRVKDALKYSHLHAALTHATHEYIHCPVPESAQLCCRLVSRCECIIHQDEKLAACRLQAGGQTSKGPAET